MTTPSVRESQFGAAAPSKNLALPKGNVTLYEQLVFLPNSLRNLAVVLRFAYNGVHQEAVSEILENGRILPKETGCTINTALRIMQHGPRFRLSHKHGSGDNWTPTKAFDTDRPGNWDKTNISWDGCRLDVECKPEGGSVVEGVPFENLAKSVSKMPTGYDALDLTRCVEVAQKNPGIYEFPRDFSAILQQLGGPAVVRYGHLDAAVARRYTKKSTVFRRRLGAGLITEPDDKPVVRDVDNTSTIGNGSPGSSAANEASSTDGFCEAPNGRLAEATLIFSTSSGIKIPSVGYAVQFPTSEIQESFVPISPSPPRRVTGNLRSTFPGKSTQRRKRHLLVSIPVQDRTDLPTLPVTPSSKRKRGDNEIISADEWAKRLKRDYYQDSDYDIVDTEYLLFRGCAAGISSPVRSPAEACSPTKNLPNPEAGEEPPESGIEVTSAASESNEFSQFQGYMSDDHFLASITTLW